MVKPSAIMTTPNNLLHLQLQVHGNRTFVGSTLQLREIGFVIEIKGRQKEMDKKYCAINLHSQRFRLSTCTRLSTRTISKVNIDFPGYDQHKCCGDFWTGCGPEARAKVFGYYDRLGSGWSYSPFSVDRYMAISTQWPQRHWTQLKKTQQQ